MARVESRCIAYHDDEGINLRMHSTTPPRRHFHGEGVYLQSTGTQGRPRISVRIEWCGRIYKVFCNNKRTSQKICDGLTPWYFFLSCWWVDRVLYSTVQRRPKLLFWSAVIGVHLEPPIHSYYFRAGRQRYTVWVERTRASWSWTLAGSNWALVTFTSGTSTHKIDQ